MWRSKCVKCKELQHSSVLTTVITGLSLKLGSLWCEAIDFTQMRAPKKWHIIESKGWRSSQEGDNVLRDECPGKYLLGLWLFALLPTKGSHNISHRFLWVWINMPCHSYIYMGRKPSLRALWIPLASHHSILPSSRALWTSLYLPICWFVLNEVYLIIVEIVSGSVLC